jgi:hypothetical protein
VHQWTPTTSHEFHLSKMNRIVQHRWQDVHQEHNSDQLYLTTGNAHVGKNVLRPCGIESLQSRAALFFLAFVSCKTAGPCVLVRGGGVTSISCIIHSDVEAESCFGSGICHRPGASWRFPLLSLQPSSSTSASTDSHA